jgi:DnaJ-class molecular chaperone
MGVSCADTKCPTCGGNGEILDAPTGMYDCPTCKGTGLQQRDFPIQEPPECEAFPEMCPICAGSGVVRCPYEGGMDETCVQCDGTGVRQMPIPAPETGAGDVLITEEPLEYAK